VSRAGAAGGGWARVGLCRAVATCGLAVQKGAGEVVEKALGAGAEDVEVLRRSDEEVELLGNSQERMP
jgi:hypothetical protein